MSKKKFAKFLSIALWLPAFAWIRCSDTLLATNDGGGSETINAKIIISDTTALFKTEPIERSQEAVSLIGAMTVRVFSNNYKPFERIGFIDSLSGNDTSALAWNAPLSGDYNFYLSIDSTGKAAFIPGIGLKNGKKDTVDCTLKKCLPFKGRIASKAEASPYVVFIPGSPFYCVSDSLLHFSMPKLPSGHFVVKTRPLKGRLFMTTNDYIVNTDSLGENVNISLKE